MDPKKACEKKGYDWNEVTKTCTRPKVGTIRMTLPRGYPCGGPNRRRKIDNGEVSLPLSVLNELLKASKPAVRAGRKKIS
jgi:hypothetical protein